MLGSSAEAVIVWWLMMLAIWVGIPAAIVYAVRRFLRAYERRTDAMARVAELERRLARLEDRGA